MYCKAESPGCISTRRCVYNEVCVLFEAVLFVIGNFYFIEVKISLLLANNHN